MGVVVRRHREALGISQEQFGFKCGLHRTYIGQVERGEKNLTVRNLVKIGRAMSLKAAQLLAEAGL